MIAELPTQLNLEEIQQLISIQEKQWVNFLLISELSRYNILLATLEKDLNSLYNNLNEDEELTDVRC